MRICKRCHRVRAVNRVGYCVGCSSNLDEMGKRRRPPEDAEAPKDELTEEPPATEQESEELVEASTDPAPAQKGPEDRKTMPEPAPQATAVEGGFPEAPGGGEAAAEAPETRSESPSSEPPAVKP